MAEILRFPNPSVPKVYLLYGPPGIGKTRLLRAYVSRYPLEVQYIAPEFYGQRFAHEVDFRRFPVWIIDSLLWWEAESMPTVVRDLEARAKRQDGRLILVLRDLKEFVRRGFFLVDRPQRIKLTSIVFSGRDLDKLPRVPRIESS